MVKRRQIKDELGSILAGESEKFVGKWHGENVKNKMMDKLCDSLNGKMWYQMWWEFGFKIKTSIRDYNG